MREIVAHSGGSRGSLGHYFPGGKTQLVTEALDLAVAELPEVTGEAPVHASENEELRTHPGERGTAVS